MIPMTEYDCEAYHKWYLPYREKFRPSVIGKAFRVDREQVEYFEEVYQGVLSGDEIYVMPACTVPAYVVLERR